MSDDLRAYLKEVMTVPTLQQFQLISLFQETEPGGPQAELARRRLIEVNLRLAVSVARKYKGRGLPLWELIEASNVGLIRAVDRYRFRTNTVPFSRYAIWWMRKAIVEALDEAWRDRLAW